MQTGILWRILNRFEEPVSSCVWAPNSKSFTLGTFDKKASLSEYNLKGEEIRSYTRKHRTEDLALSPDGHWLVAMDDQSHLYIYNVLSQELEYEIHLESRPTSISVSQDSAYLLVNKSDGELLLYNIAGKGEPVRRYAGASGGKFTIRSAFGGAHESFVISGGEGELNLRGARGNRSS
jgi:WD repeat-containing protein 26